MGSLPEVDARTAALDRDRERAGRLWRTVRILALWPVFWVADRIRGVSYPAGIGVRNLVDGMRWAWKGDDGD